MDLGCAGAPALVDNVHDLPLAPAQIAMSVFLHVNMLQKQHPVAKIASTRRPVKSLLRGYNETCPPCQKPSCATPGPCWPTTWESSCGAHSSAPPARARV